MSKTPSRLIRVAMLPLAVALVGIGPVNVDAQGSQSAAMGRPASATAPVTRAASIGEDSARVIHLLNRATFGVRPGDVAAVLAVGRDAWLEKQLHPDRIRDTLSSHLADRYPATAMSMAELFQEYSPPPRPKATAGADTAMNAEMMAAQKAKRDRTRTPQALAGELISAKLERSVRSDRQLEEVMTDFWFNHFNVFFQKGADRYLIADYEKTAIRPNVFGKFEDLLVATAQHPAMLFYLDNWQSIYVDPAMRARIAAAGRAGGAPQQQRGERGLNENYARELLELHTLGVNGGYTQADVVNVARALTGWSFIQPRAGAQAEARVQPARIQPGRVQPGRMQAGRGRAGRGAAARAPEEGFVFREALHDPAEKVVLGHKLPKGRGIEDGRDVMHIVATHPSTARFIAGKLVQYFVTDKESPALVDKLAKVFQQTNGDLREVTRTLFSSPEFYAAENRGAKVKTPYQLVASTLRATNAQIISPRGTMAVLKSMGHLPYMSSAPTGYPSVSEDWVNSGAMLARMNFGIDFAAGKVPGVRPDGRALLGGTAQTGDGLAALRAATDALIPGADPTALHSAIVADAKASAAAASAGARQADVRARAARMIGLVIGSPEFQRH